MEGIESGDIPDVIAFDDGKFEKVPVSLYENFYHDASEDNDNDGEKDSTLRVFRSDSEVDMAVFLEGRAPSGSGEIAIDRMHASNVGIKIGDTITVDGSKFEVVGLLSYVNYLTLHENNTDLMFDAFGFDVGMVVPEAFDKLSSRIHYSYAFFFEDEPSDKYEEARMADDFLKVLLAQTLVNGNGIEDYLPEYLRQASNFAPSDIDSDSLGTGIFCNILIAVIAFIFAVTISNTIDKEASVIGTLRASGYSKNELAVHFMMMPFIVTIIGAVTGNVLGYTVFKNMAIYLYYNSYSLPAPRLAWSPSALIKTTVIPLILMFAINLFVIIKKLRLSPLKFLRHDLTKTRRSKARRIPSWSFMRRFRIRIMLQNLPNYAILMFGVILIELMMCFAFGLPDSLNKYADNAPQMIFADYQYMLMGCHDSDGRILATSDKSAERFSSKTLKFARRSKGLFEGMGSGEEESVTCYGIIDGSAYVFIPEDMKEGEIYISSAYAAKYDLDEGDVIKLREEYRDKSYEFTVKGTVDYDGGIAVFMNNDDFNVIFEKDEDEFTGFFSSSKISDIDEQYIASVITVEDITKVTNQLMHSMGGFMEVFKYALVIMAAALIYLLAKIIIEKNEHSISMTKILGFTNAEIGSLYIVPTATVVVSFSVLGFIAGYFLMLKIFKVFMLQMDGYFSFFMRPSSMILSVLYLLAGYLFVSLIDYMRIRKIPTDVALKNME